MTVETYIKNTSALIVFGILFISLFGWWLIREYRKFDFSQRHGKLEFIVDNLSIMGGVLMGIGFILLAIFA